MALKKKHIGRKLNSGMTATALCVLKNETIAISDRAAQKAKATHGDDLSRHVGFCIKVPFKMGR